MKRFFYPFFIVLVLFGLVACGGESGEVSFSTANIQNAMLTDNENGTEAVTTFEQDAVVYLLADLNNAPDDTMVKTVWTAVDADGTAPNTQITEAELETGSGQLTFNLTPDGFLPVGDYKVDLYLNDELDQTLTFQIEGDIPAASADPTDAAAEETTEEPADEPAEEADSSGALSGIDNIRPAVVQIETVGSFISPEYGEGTSYGAGSGFIINEEGVVVTNHHVASGAALVKVMIPGHDEPLNARVLGQSQCWDLAVLDIEGSGFDYLDWYDGDIKVGLDMYIAGYPLGEPEYSLTSGIISKEEADGSTYWSDVPSVLVYDAVGNPGNSGGPVVDENGRVIAVHYRGRSAARQAFGIAAQDARPIIERLQAGESVEDIGINGEIVQSEDGSIVGLWVSAVTSGSMADEAGIRSGDIITRFEGIQVGTDGTMSDFCNILRSRGEEAVFSIEVLRLSSGEVLEGQINGRELVVTSGGAAAQSGSGSSGGDAPASSGGFQAITDDTGQLYMEVPTSWSQVDGSAWIGSDGNQLGLKVDASPDLDGFNNSFGTPGVSFKVSDSLGSSVTDLADAVDLSSNCTYGGREDYSDGFYTGVADFWENCGSAGSTFLVLVAQPADASYLVALEVNMVSEADNTALQQILDTFILQQ